MSRHREFSTARAEAAGDPITFSLDGETFTVAGLEAGPVLDLVAAIPGGLDFDRVQVGDLAELLPALSKFVEDIVVDEDRERWHKAMRHVTPQTFMEIVSYVVEEATARPLAGAGESATSPSTPGEPSSTTSPNDVNTTPSGSPPDGS